VRQAPAANLQTMLHWARVAATPSLLGRNLSLFVSSLCLGASLVTQTPSARLWRTRPKAESPKAAPGLQSGTVSCSQLATSSPLARRPVACRQTGTFGATFTLVLALPKAPLTSLEKKAHALHDCRFLLLCRTAFALFFFSFPVFLFLRVALLLWAPKSGGNTKASN